MFKCHVCGSEESHLEYIDKIFNINGAFHLVEHVPATVCDRCGEKALSRETTEHIRVKLNGKQHVAVVESDRWTKEDIADLSKFSLQYAATIYPDDQELI